MTVLNARCPACGCRYNPTTDACRGCAYRRRRAAEVGDGHRCKDCSTPVERGGLSRCPSCAAARVAPDYARRGALAKRRLPAPARDRLLRLLEDGTHFTEAVSAVGSTPQAVYGLRVYLPGWADALDEALLMGRDPSLPHGTHQTYRWHRCRCPECREVKKPR
ncbi:hypothetical protein SEA_HFRANCETTE_55 [Streptomyces phage HFrancette]|uniref:Uncharacterized protein n=5 Tax=Ignaciovirus TaxID=3152509 RepID=A0A6M9Z4G5_9CAUD|nr:hypothetical protein QEN60_gp54 [Streptomyces phage Ignacio]YP_010756347.1 hypothetical protein QEN63_gp53 [Streptomyces phage Vondra]YP_010756406.1 hypothetical protein QEN64_gp55 [Streptomyces phage HFrancette]YP_010756465.1 hypothetical protein QEN65_gp55 [Streptomyces phage Cumberbatch]YP_010756523.1 hypothetical protein QEN66_gp54 [Streptomyces phage Piccadilly]YP_010756581.1 hypothetical protein QEN67_gp54 [Streptomyces phage Eastland]QKN87581.1 hypothetical protein SEA_IGNACIO_54 [S